MIIFKDVTKTFFPQSNALEQVSFTIEPGEFVVLTGRSGAGKTTIGRLLIREFLPTEGDISVGDYELKSLHPKEVPGLRRQIGFAFQDFKLLPEKTIAENIALVLEIINKSADEVVSKVIELLEKTGIRDKAHLFPHQLSGGEMQRAAIARALASDPAVLFADEPTGNLDLETATQIMQLLETINQAGTTVIMSTHNIEHIDKRKHRIIKLHKGKLTEDTGSKKSHKADKHKGDDHEKALEKTSKDDHSPKENNE